MRISLPERFTFPHTLGFATLLLVGQMLTHTEPVFAVLCFAYIFIFAAAYNVAGGIYFPSGSYIFFNGLLGMVVGLTYKVLLREPGQSNLLSPNTTMLVYCGGMAGMGVAAWICRAIRPAKGLLAGMSTGANMKSAAIGCLVFGLVLQILTFDPIHEQRTLSSALNQLNHFEQVAIILGTTYEIIHSKGKRSTNWIVWTAGIYTFVFGIFAFSKEGMFFGLSTWAVAAVIQRFNFPKLQLIGGAIGLFFILYYLVPYSQYGRSNRDDTNRAVQARAAVGLLENLGQTRKDYLDSGEVQNFDGTPHLYSESQGLFDRLEMLAPDDSLIDYTEQGNVEGLAPTYESFLNVIPRFFWPNKPMFGSGGTYGRELGMISEDDMTTGISFSPSADAFHEARWLGLFLVEPLVMLILFYIADALSGDVRLSPWGLLFVAMFTHFAPEGLLGGAVWMASFGAETVILAAVLSTYVLPYLTGVMRGGGTAVGRRHFVVRMPAPRAR